MGKSNKKLKHSNKIELDDLKINLLELSNTISSLKDSTTDISSEVVTTSMYLKEKARDSIFRFFSVIDSINDLVIVQDNNCRWRTLNKFGQELFKLNPKQFVGKTNEELSEILDDSYNDLLNKCAFMTKAAWEEKVPVRSTESFTFGDKIIYFDIIKTPTYYSNGEPKELVILGRDVTEVIQMQQRNKACIAALNSASDIIVISDAEGHITFCNDSFIKNFKFNSIEEVEGKTFSIINSGKMSQEFFKYLWTTIKSNKVWTNTIINKRTDGTLLNCLVTILPVMNGEPEPIYYICSMKTSYV